MKVLFLAVNHQLDISFVLRKLNAGLLERNVVKAVVPEMIPEILQYDS
jgi:hypothetical protein